MVKFKNILTKHVFTLPEDKAIEVIMQAPEIYEIISGLDKDFTLLNLKPGVNLAELKDIYNIVVEEDSTETEIPAPPEGCKTKRRAGKKMLSKRKEKK